MPLEVFRSLMTFLLFTVVFSCFWIFSNHSCQVFLSESSIQGPFCAIEQATAPETAAPEHNCTFICAKETLAKLVPLAIFLTTFFVLVLTDPVGVLFFKHQRQTFIRSGPHQKTFLPYLMPTHGM